MYRAAIGAYLSLSEVQAYHHAKAPTTKHWCWQAESWAFALDSHSLGMLMKAGIFWMRTCKLCVGDEGIVVASEYGMSKLILDAGFNLATLMARCSVSCACAGPPYLDCDCPTGGWSYTIYALLLWKQARS